MTNCTTPVRSPAGIAGFRMPGIGFLPQRNGRCPGTPRRTSSARFASADGGDHPVCPRSLLRRVLDRGARSGLSAQAGFEYEFFVFREDADSVRAKGYRGMQPITPGNFGYSVLRGAANAGMFTGLMDYCAGFRMPLEGLHCETGPGFGKRRSRSPTAWRRLTGRPCSRRSARRFSSNVRTWRRSWPSGRWTIRAKRSLPFFDARCRRPECVRGARRAG